jgi:hypothetical protein
MSGTIKLYAKSPLNVVVGPITNCVWAEKQLTNCSIPGVINVAAGWSLYLANTGATGTPIASQQTGSTAANPVMTIGSPAPTVGSGKTFVISSAQGTFPWTSNTFFINDVGAGGTGVSYLVTCSGITTATQFTNCTGLPNSQIKAGATITSSYLSNLNDPTIGGWIKIERQDADSSWHDVTMEILNYGIGAPNVDGFGCGDPSPNAIVRLQRLRDNSATQACPILDLTNSYEYWPNALFDTREGTFRDADPGDNDNGVASGLRLNGAIYYVAVDVRNLAKWFRAAAPYNTGTGGGVKIDNTGYTLYFSDRRNNRNALNQETAEYGFEDVVNSGVANGVPNGSCNAGEDVNGDNVCDVYGQFPSFDGVYNTSPLLSPLDGNARPWKLVKRGYLQVNRPVLFRRALKLINGRALNNTPTVAAERIGGLTVVSENPVYIHGNWNAYDAASFAVGAPHAATSIIADAVTILSTNWNDTSSFETPYCASTSNGPSPIPVCPAGRLRQGEPGNLSNTYYRVAILAGKPPLFNKPSDLGATPSVFGTDGGAHNFLRMLEGDAAVSVNPTTTVNYRGAMATLYFSRQGTGTFKCCSGMPEDGIVYSVPVRAFQFDTDFTVPALLPPNTPMFRDMDVVGFSQELRPGR